MKIMENIPLILLGVIILVIVIVVVVKKNGAKKEKEAAIMRENEEKEKREEGVRKFREEKNKTIAETGRADYDHLYKFMLDNMPSDAIFYDEIFNDKDFWHADINTIFEGWSDVPEYQSMSEAKSIVMQQLRALGFRDSINPFLEFIHRFVDTRQSETEKIRSGNWGEFHNLVVDKTEGIQNDTEKVLFIRELFNKVDYKVFTLSYYDFKDYLKEFC